MIELYLSVDKQVTTLELSTGVPLLYIYTEGKYMSRGSPVGPTEAGVYAYTQVCFLCFTGIYLPDVIGDMKITLNAILKLTMDQCYVRVGNI